MLGNGDVDKHEMWALWVLDVRALLVAHEQPHVLGVP